MRVLDLGCGNAKRTGATGVDIREMQGVDVVWDLNRRPWPFGENSYDSIHMRHVIEHLDDPVAALGECHRVLTPGGEVTIATPHFSSVNSWEDPTHRHHFSLGSFDFLAGTHPSMPENYSFAIIERRLTFGGGIGPTIGRVLAFFGTRAYERRAAFRYPARNIIVRLRAEKGQDANSH
jgi:SAM-dependent methyltransferase